MHVCAHMRPDAMATWSVRRLQQCPGGETGRDQWRVHLGMIRHNVPCGTMPAAEQSPVTSENVRTCLLPKLKCVYVILRLVFSSAWGFKSFHLETLLHVPLLCMSAGKVNNCAAGVTSSSIWVRVSDRLRAEISQPAQLSPSDLLMHCSDLMVSNVGQNIQILRFRQIVH